MSVIESSERFATGSTPRSSGQDRVRETSVLLQQGQPPLPPCPSNGNWGGAYRAAAKQDFFGRLVFSVGWTLYQASATGCNPNTPVYTPNAMPGVDWTSGVNPYAYPPQTWGAPPAVSPAAPAGTQYAAPAGAGVTCPAGSSPQVMPSGYTACMANR